MIRSVFLIHESGLCLLSRSYDEDSKRNIDLFSGLLVAISSFARNLIGEEINEIRMEHHNIFYESRKTLVLALVTSEKKIAKRKLSTIMRRIYSNFIQQYQEYLKQEIIEPQIFEAFADTIDRILQTSDVVRTDLLPEEKRHLTNIH
ncbi:MAG: hypothetical protein ACXADY_08685 [Candidatus Hodarchaeales archaeon]|jgi:hypothetical protein